MKYDIKDQWQVMANFILADKEQMFSTTINQISLISKDPSEQWKFTKEKKEVRAQSVRKRSMHHSGRASHRGSRYHHPHGIRTKHKHGSKESNRSKGSKESLLSPTQPTIKEERFSSQGNRTKRTQEGEGNASQEESYDSNKINEDSPIKVEAEIGPKSTKYVLKQQPTLNPKKMIIRGMTKKVKTLTKSQAPKFADKKRTSTQISGEDIMNKIMSDNKHPNGKGKVPIRSRLANKSQIYQNKSQVINDEKLQTDPKLALSTLKACETPHDMLRLGRRLQPKGLNIIKRQKAQSLINSIQTTIEATNSKQFNIEDHLERNQLNNIDSTPINVSINHDTDSRLNTPHDNYRPFSLSPQDKSQSTPINMNSVTECQRQGNQNAIDIHLHKINNIIHGVSKRSHNQSMNDHFLSQESDMMNGKTNLLREFNQKQVRRHCPSETKVRLTSRMQRERKKKQQKKQVKPLIQAVSRAAKSDRELTEMLLGQLKKMEMGSSNTNEVHQFLNLMKLKKMYPSSSKNDTIFTSELTNNSLMSPKITRQPFKQFKSCKNSRFNSPATKYESTYKPIPMKPTKSIALNTSLKRDIMSPFRATKLNKNYKKFDWSQASSPKAGARNFGKTQKVKINHFDKRARSSQEKKFGTIVKDEL